MSLISTRNLIAPLTNKVHLVTIFLFAICFAALRLSGGSLHVTKRSTVEHIKSDERVIGTQQAAPSLFPRLHQKARTKATGLKTRGPAPTLQRARPQDLTGLLAEMQSRRKQTESNPAPAVPPTKKQGGLDDIERKLGL